MGYAGKLEEKQKAQELRKRGLSVREIQKKLGVSRSSVSLWCRDIQLTQKQLEKLYLNQKTGALRGCIIGAKKKQKERESETGKLIKVGKAQIGSLNKRDLFIAGVALYAGEGEKTDGAIGFSNSDYRTIRFMMKWFREICGVSENKFRGSLYIHDNLDEKKAKKYWSNITKIPLPQFTKSYIAKDNPNRLRKTKHNYGVFRIRISDAKLHRRIIGWIKGILERRK